MKESKMCMLKLTYVVITNETKIIKLVMEININNFFHAGKIIQFR